MLICNNNETINSVTKKKKSEEWAADEFSQVDLGDERLNKRLITLCGRFSDSPERSDQSSLRGLGRNEGSLPLLSK